MLGWALAQDNVAVVLCSMLDEAHLRANLDTIERAGFSAAELAALRRLGVAGMHHARDLRSPISATARSRCRWPR